MLSSAAPASSQPAAGDAAELAAEVARLRRQVDELRVFSERATLRNEQLTRDKEDLEDTTATIEVEMRVALEKKVEEVKADAADKLKALQDALEHSRSERETTDAELDRAREEGAC